MEEKKTMKMKNTPLVNDTLSKEVRFENEKRGMIYFQMVKHAVAAGLDKEKFARAAVNRIGRDNSRDFGKYDSLPEFVYSFMNEGLISQFRPELKEMDDDRARVDFHYCPMLGGLSNMTEDADELELLCDCAMETDRGLTSSLGLGFELGHTIATGYDTCELCFKWKEKR
ncbi:MAG: L-2-amino-thiazoline-4-carboxylic acid hydrolase [Lachnospiraceae bacterium]|nr:L-2-amino-thiazoline-4-carboxylic acid hydrolase [Lachnospiraceae bacterium]